MPDISDILDSILTGASPAYRAAGQAPYELEAAKQRAKQAALQTSTIQSTLDDLSREREERSAAPEALSRVYRAAQPQPGVSDLEGTSPGRGAARTPFDLMSRGVSPEDIDLAARQRKDAFAGLGLMSPEAAQQKDIENKSRARSEGLMSQLDALDPNAPDYAAQARAVITRMAAGAKPESALHGVNQAEGAGEPEGERIDLAKGVKTITSRDSATGAVKTRVVPMAEGDQVIAHINRLVGLQRAARSRPLTDDEQQQWRDSAATVNTARQTPMPAGAAVMPRGVFEMEPPGAAKTPMPGGPSLPPGAPPGAIRFNPDKIAETTLVSYGQGRWAANEMERLAPELERLMPDATTRLSFALRAMAQGIPVARAFGDYNLSPEEQAVATQLRHVQLRYEAAMAGLRGAGSPQMYDRMLKIIGDPASATTPSALRSLSQTMHSYLDTVRTLEQGVGHKELPTLKEKEPGLVDRAAGVVTDAVGAATNAVRGAIGAPAGGGVPPGGQGPSTGTSGDRTGLPDPIANKGRIIRDTQTGTRLKSDGTKWVPQ